MENCACNIYFNFYLAQMKDNSLQKNGTNPHGKPLFLINTRAIGEQKLCESVKKTNWQRLRSTGTLIYDQAIQAPG